MTHAALLLAAGGSRRLGVAKQLLTHQGIPLVRRVAQLLLETEPSRLVIVTGGNEDAVQATLDHLPVHLISNPEWQSGMASSIQAGLATFGELPAALLIAGTDQPFLTSADLARLLAARPAGGDIITGYDSEGAGGLPACLARQTLRRVHELHGDEGFRRLWRDGPRPARVLAPHLAFDIDTPEHLTSAIHSGAIDPI